MSPPFTSACVINTIPYTYLYAYFFTCGAQRTTLWSWLSASPLPCGLWRQNSGHQAWWQNPLPTESLHHPPNILLLYALHSMQTGKCQNSDCFTNGLTSDLTALWFHICCCMFDNDFSQFPQVQESRCKVFLNFAGSSEEANTQHGSRLLHCYSHRCMSEPNKNLVKYLKWCCTMSL